MKSDSQAEGPVLVAQGLVKDYGRVRVVDGIDLAVSPGEMFGFLGPNGAGKTTTIRMLCTLTKPSSGTARVAGFDVVTQREDVRRSLGLVFQESTLDIYLTAKQNLRFQAGLYGLARSGIDHRIAQVLAAVGFEDRAGQEVRTLSGGERRRLEVARALLHSPKVLFLDEPTAGLDPQSRRSIWMYIEKLRKESGMTVFLTTHYLEEAEVCDRIAIIDKGNIVVEGTPQALKAALGEDRIQLQTSHEQSVITALDQSFGIQAASRDGVVAFSVADGPSYVPQILSQISAPIDSVTVTRPTLDDVFLSFTGSTISDADAKVSA